LWGPKLPRKGETITGFRSGFFTGGKGANQAVQAARLGADVYMIGKLGKDVAGDTLMASLKRDGVNTDFIKIEENDRTGTCAIMVDENGDNMIMTAPAANLTISAGEIEAAISKLGEFDLLLTQLETNLESVEYALTAAKRAGTPVILNSAPAKKIPDSFFDGVAFATPNETETEAYTGIMPSFDNKGETREAAARLLAKGVENVVFTLGSAGAFYTNGKQEIYAPAYKIKAVDATAAGDAFNAALAVKIAGGAGIHEAMSYANAAGAVAASRAGAQPSLGTAAELEEFLKGR
jgi:ribokinase